MSELVDTAARIRYEQMGWEWGRLSDAGKRALIDKERPTFDAILDAVSNGLVEQERQRIETGIKDITDTIGEIGPVYVRLSKALRVVRNDA